VFSRSSVREVPRRAGALGFVALVLVLSVLGCAGRGPAYQGGAGGHSAGAGGGFGGARLDGHPTGGAAGAVASVPDGGCSMRDGGPVTKRATGASCACAADCASGFCVDGVCCSEACQGGCRTCGLTGSEGTCVARPDGSDPRLRSDCAASDPGSCGLDGRCDGAGACRKYPNGTVCQKGQCDGASVSGTLVCDGAGHCRPGPTVVCDPFSCDPNAKACYGACSSNSQCVNGHVCDASGSCGKRMIGGGCAKDADCLSGFCANNVCCNVACQGPCVSCALPAREGTCWPTEAGVADPNKLCADQGAPSCGTNGKCDGLGSCARYPADTECAISVCYGSKLNTSATCDGLGTCRPPGLVNCSPFRCTEGACTVTCKADSDCDVGIACVNGTCGPKQNGQTCKAAGECKSGQCVDGFCCESACSGACRSCGLASSPGKCTVVGAGNADPRAICKDAGATSCGQNGRCDGAGACQLYPKTTTCKEESCASNVYTPVSSCDGAGHCVTPALLPCSPFACNGSKCFVACTVTSQCVSPNSCVGGSCGLVNNGAACSSGNQCKSGFCAQGYCCDKACNGACQSCGLTGTLGACTNVATGSSDPSGTCKDQGSTSCGTNGRCQSGACQKYASGTSCAAATCPGGTPTFTGSSTCDGNGKCVTPAARSCAPFLCGTGACKNACTSNGDCASPATCISGSCGLKANGTACADGVECKSAFCRQGVCCATECNSTCKSCNASAATSGTCTNVAVGGSDPAKICADMGAASCGTNGVCDGSGACQRYAAGTICAPASCPTGMSTQSNARSCDGAGVCKPATTTACAPYVCNGTTACNSACTKDADCVMGQTCDLKTNLCGAFQRQGQPCSASAKCLSGLTCLDGVCCASASCLMCQACNVTGSAGTCANVPAGTAEPRGMCAPGGTCGNTGACNGAGACQKQDTTVSCAAATCTGSTAKAEAHCDGMGSCGAAVSINCSPYVCGPNACKTACTTNDDCLAPFTCQGSGSTKSCALKPNGVACSAGSECISGNCVDGVCCGTPSCPACNSCGVNGAGSCAPLGAGATDARCGATSPCGKTNVCDGAGACRNSTAVCQAAACNGTTFTPAQSCAGTAATACPAGTPTSCGAYACDVATGCKTTCAADTDCAAGSFCNPAGKCISRGTQGDSCSKDNECGAGHCVDGVCCNTTGTSCPLCQACNVTGSKGTCAFVGTGASEPHGLCATGGVCGNTGACAADQSCAKASTATMCGPPTCSAGTETRAAFCDGAGSCAAPVVRACDPFVCGPTACLTVCVLDTDCIPGDYCAGGTCRTKVAPGATCTSTAECASGVCGAEGVCCDSACDGSCESCRQVTSPGTCRPLDAGTTCSATCSCDGAGMCSVCPPPPPPM
jgi:hypothetical protein